MSTAKSSMLGIWDVTYNKSNTRLENKKLRGVYGDPTTAKLAADWLTSPDIKTVEDWGCGFGGFENYTKKWQTYIGVDGSKTVAASVIADLVKYTSQADGILIRHVLEHNKSWESILKNCLASFKKRAAIVIFTPLNTHTEILNTHRNWQNTGIDIVDISFSWEDLKKIIEQYPDIKYKTKFNILTNTCYKSEHIIYLERN
jgi:hypothetical protein